MDKRQLGASIFWLLSLALLLAGCNAFRDNDIGSVETDIIRIPLEDAQTVTVELFNGVGDLRLYTGGTAEDEIMAGTLTYNVADWAPQVSYNVDEDKQGVLAVRQPELLTGLGFEDAGEIRYEYDLALNP
ncbi:MAG: hypothetical protein KDD89_12910, partial [Anaerolineales bacterium]|nr:hypothetical protein [Anaerolineales bacterium]